MRIVAGSAKGRRLVAPDGTATRPTGDRVREATFNALTSLDALDGVVVLDLYAGSGAMGLEALSRGASSATFVDSDPRALAAIRANVAATGFTDVSRVVRSDVPRFLAEQRARVGLAVLDPPYALADEAWSALLSSLAAEVAVLESDRELAVPGGWEILRARRYGTTVITLAARR
ncbi:MAG: 16S rRNA (guanine(966)-N(2))-methyltransferase RsmD [Actinomycetota bacterium]|nr:16S rRNA (guanine(966)-N(2))-methyltransferase RsmD [Actinomycetota bacterium]